MAIIKDYRTETGEVLPGIELPDGVRLLGRTPPPPGKLMGVAPTWKAAGKPVIDPKDYPKYVFDRTRTNVPQTDQNGRGACNAFAWKEVVECLRDAEGQAHIPLSAWFLYAQINGGSDSGSNISDGATYLQSKGIALDSAVPQGAYLLRQIPQAAYADIGRFTIADGEWYVCEDFDDMVAAAICGFHLNASIYVGNDFNNLDADHCPPVHRGAGNHAITPGEALYMGRNGEPILKTRNHWTKDWGWNGWFGYRRGHQEYQSYYECIAVKSAGFDPQDPNRAPVAA